MEPFNISLQASAMSPVVSPIEKESSLYPTPSFLLFKFPKLLDGEPGYMTMYVVPLPSPILFFISYGDLGVNMSMNESRLYRLL